MERSMGHPNLQAWRNPACRGSKNLQPHHPSSYLQLRWAVDVQSSPRLKVLCLRPLLRPQLGMRWMLAPK